MATASSTGPARSKPKRTFVLTRENGDRAEEINDFYNGFMGLERSMDAYRWEFQDCPDGPALVYTISEPARDHRVVGHHSIVPTRLVCKGQTLAGGRTENTIVDPEVRHRVFYPGMEKKTLGEVLESFSVLYTIHSRGPAPFRKRFGYRPAGRWVVFMPKVGAGYLRSLVKRVRGALPLADAAAPLLSKLAAALQSATQRLQPRPSGAELREIDDIGEIAEEYQRFWARSRGSYDLTIDRSLEFLRWRVSNNPHLRFRTWTVRRRGELLGVIIAHWHRIGDATALYVDDLIARDYDEECFDVLVRLLSVLDAAADSVVVMTLTAETPLLSALRRHHRMQSWLLERFGARVFDEMLVLDRSPIAGDVPWYVTPIFTEGMDTSRSEV